MKEDTITALPDPNGFSADPLADLIRSGARQLIEQALEVELSALLAQFSQETTEDGRARLVRNGHLPERKIMSGVGPVAVKMPRVRDRGKQAE
ncbi:transposase, mutator type [Rhodobacterales bacterium Y4I]|nr:transposase, mutator type [Rhodobacterales bacterium Y4I]